MTKKISELSCCFSKNFNALYEIKQNFHSEISSNFKKIISKLRQVAKDELSEHKKYCEFSFEDLKSSGLKWENDEWSFSILCGIDKLGKKRDWKSVSFGVRCYFDSSEKKQMVVEAKFINIAQAPYEDIDERFHNFLNEKGIMESPSIQIDSDSFLIFMSEVNEDVFMELEKKLVSVINYFPVFFRDYLEEIRQQQKLEEAQAKLENETEEVPEFNPLGDQASKDVA